VPYTSRIPRIADELVPAVSAAVALAADLVMADAKVRAPVETGRLKEAIHVDRVGEMEYMVRAGNTDVFYGHIVEHGGVRHAGQPFLVPALEAERRNAVGIVRSAIQRAS
jgi:HK97 gp10 family phage protein